MNKALWSGIIAFSAWGLFPIYWKYFNELSGYDLFNHRLFWSFFTLGLWAVYKNKFPELYGLWKSPKKKWLVLSAFLITSNWFLYVIAITQNKIVEASMGYFLNPLLNVLFGWLFLKETLRPGQWPSLILALIGVGVMFTYSGLEQFPWMAIILSLTFAVYGLIRKMVHVGSLEGLTFENFIVFLHFMILWNFKSGSLIKGYETLGFYKYLALACSGLVSAFPLALFSYASKNLKLQTLGLTQYLSPTFKFLCGWAIFHEVIAFERWIGFIFIWSALLWYSLESVHHHRKISMQKSLI